MPSATCGALWPWLRTSPSPGRRLGSPPAWALPAAAAGLTGAYRNTRGEIVLGDIITHIEDRAIRTHDDYFSAMESHEPGDKVVFRTRLGKEEKRYDITLIESQ